MTTRETVMDRARTLWAPGTVEYSMTAIKDAAWRQDCSGYVSMCWEIPPGPDGGPNTATLVAAGWMYEIDPDDLREGDAVGNCGPGTEGAAGHVQIFERWENQDVNDNRYWCWEQTPDAGPQNNPHDLGRNGYRAYRFVAIEDQAPAPEPTPPPAERRSVVVVTYTDDNPPWNSTLSGIAEHYGVTVEHLAIINGIDNVDLIYPDQVIYIDPA